MCGGSPLFSEVLKTSTTTYDSCRGDSQERRYNFINSRSPLSDRIFVVGLIMCFVSGRFTGEEEFLHSRSPLSEPVLLSGFKNVIRVGEIHRRGGISKLSFSPL